MRKTRISPQGRGREHSRKSTLIFVLLCVSVFALCSIVSFMLTVQVVTDAPYRYLRVKNDPSVWKAEYDLDSDGKATTKYDLYLPVAPEEGKEYTLLFYVHGGGFTSGGKEEGSPVCPYYASRGVIAASANYSMAGDGANLNQMFSELRNTIAAAKEHCETLGYPVKQMVPCGLSAGGCLALLLAYREVEASHLPVAFCFAQSAPVSFEPTLWAATEDEQKAALVSELTGISFSAEDVGSEAYQEELDRISPASLVNETSVPTILGYGPSDVVVPPEIKEVILEKLEEYSVPYDYFFFPNSGHGLLRDPEVSEAFYREVDAYLEKYAQ